MATIKKIAQQKGWDFQKNYMYGQEENYLITVRQVIDYLNGRNNCKMVYIPLSNITEEQVNKTLDYLKENKKDLKVREYHIVQSVLVFKLAETLKGYSVEQFNTLISSLVNFFKSNEIATIPTCVYCQDGNVNTIMKIDKIAYHAHQECITRAQSDLVQSKENFETMKKHYGRGMVGAILGALIGAIPWVLLEIYWGFAAVLALIIGYAAFYGYKKFGGVVTKATKWLILIAILIAVVVSNIVTVTYIIISSDALLIIDNYIISYTDPEIAPIVLSDLFIGILFVLLGFISIYRKIKSEEFGKVIE